MNLATMSFDWAWCCRLFNGGQWNAMERNESDHIDACDANYERFKTPIATLIDADFWTARRRFNYNLPSQLDGSSDVTASFCTFDDPLDFSRILKDFSRFSRIFSRIFKDSLGFFADFSGFFEFFKIFQGFFIFSWIFEDFSKIFQRIFRILYRFFRIFGFFRIL